MPGHKEELYSVKKRIEFYRPAYAGRASREFLCKIPWWVFSILQEMEASGNYMTHMHNGDPLARPTVNEPKGRPEGWMNLPKEERSWIRSAIDAAEHDELDKTNWGDLDAALDRFERFNGLGYRKTGRSISPYLWSYTNQYNKGKFSSDGVYDPDLVSKQPGVVAIMKTLELFKCG